MDISVELNGTQRNAKVLFAGGDDLHFVNDWRKVLGKDQNPVRVDAVDFAQVAVARFEAHSAIEPYAKSVGDIGDHIGNNPRSEVACFVLLRCDWFPDSEVIGIAHFRRTWSNRIVLDYLSSHPFIVRPPDSYPTVVKGVGTALLYSSALWPNAMNVTRFGVKQLKDHVGFTGKFSNWILWKT